MSFREELINSVHEEHRAEYADTLPVSIVNRQGIIAGIRLRIIKGAQALQLQEALLTREGIATRDGRIVDCSAAIVQKKADGWHRYSGKDAPNVTNILSHYNPDLRKFYLAAEDADQRVIVETKEFDVSILQPRDGEIVNVKFGNAGMLEGVLENGPLTDHIRECLSSFEKRVEDLGVLIRHPSFVRSSDTRREPVPGVNTLYSDGSQIHGLNRNTLDWQNQTISRRMSVANYRPGLEFNGQDLTPNIEDLIDRVTLHSANGTDVPLYFTGLTPRCVVPQRDLRTGKPLPEPKTWLRSHRPVRPDKLLTMGANMDMDPAFNNILIQRGDKFTIESEKASWTQ